MPAGLYNLYVEKGATYYQEFFYLDAAEAPIDITNYAVRMQARPSVQSSTILFEASTVNGYITVNGPLGKIIVKIPDTVTAAIGSCTEGVYDMEIQAPVPSNTVTRVLYGAVEISPEVTR